MMTTTWMKPEFVIVAVTLEVTAYSATR